VYDCPFDSPVTVIVPDPLRVNVAVIFPGLLVATYFVIGIPPLYNGEIKEILTEDTDACIAVPINGALKGMGLNTTP
jgi:hypothetical protein